MEKPTAKHKAVVVSVLNLKGGVGKTTLCVAIGEMLAHEFNKSVLLIDLDSQSNLTAAMVGNPNKYRSQDRSIYHLFKELLAGRALNPRWNLASAAITPAGNLPTPNLSVVISLPELGQFDEDLADALDQQQQGCVRINITWRKVLRNQIEPVRDQYDYIFIDCPPSLSIFTSNALVASDYFVTPMAPEFLSIQGLDLIESRLQALKAKPDLRDTIRVKFGGTILNRVDIRRRDHKARAAGILGQSQFFAFQNWVGDHKPMYLTTDYGYPKDVLGRPWRDLREKLGGGALFRNPRGSSLEFKNESERYTIFDRLKRLSEEFLGRCK